jgi:hypothetical protein
MVDVTNQSQFSESHPQWLGAGTKAGSLNPSQYTSHNSPNASRVHCIAAHTFTVYIMHTVGTDRRYEKTDSKIFVSKMKLFEIFEFLPFRSKSGPH